MSHPESHSDFRDVVYPPDHPRVADIRGLDARQYAEAVKSDSFAGPMIEGWAKLYRQPFRGITNDGTIRTGLYALADAQPGEEAPAAAMTDAALTFFTFLTPAQRERLRYPIDAVEWRSWANPEFMQHDTGLRLDELDAQARERALELVRSSLSAEGDELVRNLMYINGFLGDIVELPLLMNEFSYNIAVYGEPSLTEPWGWHLFGHHVALNCLVVGTQMVVSPVFLGAEPSLVDAGPRAGLRVFTDRIAPARALMASLSDAVRAQVQIYGHLVDAAMPPGRLHPGDERHLGGCFQDNRVIPYEGIRVSTLEAAQRDLVSEIIQTFIAYLPAGPARARLREIETHYDETWFSWIGGWQGDEPFYFRVQSPVVIAELDHHCGVFLSNDEPADFHIHTVLRTPNGNDYGRELVAQKLTQKSGWR